MVRSIPSSILSILITLGLILTMYGLIKMDEPELEQKKSVKLPSFKKHTRNEDLETIVPKPERPDIANEQPDTPDVEIVPDKVDIDSNIGLGAVKVGINKDLKGFNSNDGEYLPIFRPPPQYPNRAAERDMCGWVILSFTVTADGGTRDPVVTSSSSSIFERAAKKAVLKYKYKPRQVGGKPVDVPNVSIKVSFEMDGREGCSDKV